MLLRVTVTRTPPEALTSMVGAPLLVRTRAGITRKRRNNSKRGGWRDLSTLLKMVSKMVQRRRLKLLNLRRK
jgi:hypothetical protein